MKYENFFDAVIDNVSIQCNPLRDIIKMYQNVFSALKSNGKFITVVFGKETTGYGTGIMIEEGTYENLTQGNLQGLGCRHFFEHKELMGILDNIGFRNVKTDFIKYSDRGNIVHQIIAVGEK